MLLSGPEISSSAACAPRARCWVRGRPRGAFTSPGASPHCGSPAAPKFLPAPCTWPWQGCRGPQPGRAAGVACGECGWSGEGPNRRFIYSYTKLEFAQDSGTAPPVARNAKGPSVAVRGWSPGSARPCGSLITPTGTLEWWLWRRGAASPPFELAAMQKRV